MTEIIKRKISKQNSNKINCIMHKKTVKRLSHNQLIMLISKIVNDIIPGNDHHYNDKVSMTHANDSNSGGSAVLRGIKRFKSRVRESDLFQVSIDTSTSSDENSDTSTLKNDSQFAFVMPCKGLESVESVKLNFRKDAKILSTKCNRAVRKKDINSSSGKSTVCYLNNKVNVNTRDFRDSSEQALNMAVFIDHFVNHLECLEFFNDEGNCSFVNLFNDSNEYSFCSISISNLKIHLFDSKRFCVKCFRLKRLLLTDLTKQEQHRFDKMMKCDCRRNTTLSTTAIDKSKKVTNIQRDHSLNDDKILYSFTSVVSNFSNVSSSSKEKNFNSTRTLQGNDYSIQPGTVGVVLDVQMGSLDPEESKTITLSRNMDTLLSVSSVFNELKDDSGGNTAFSSAKDETAENPQSRVFEKHRRRKPKNIQFESYRNAPGLPVSKIINGRFRHGWYCSFKSCQAFNILKQPICSRCFNPRSFYPLFASRDVLCPSCGYINYKCRLYCKKCKFIFITNKNPD